MLIRKGGEAPRLNGEMRTQGLMERGCSRGA